MDDCRRFMATQARCTSNWALSEAFVNKTVTESLKTNLPSTLPEPCYIVLQNSGKQALNHAVRKLRQSFRQSQFLNGKDFTGLQAEQTALLQCDGNFYVMSIQYVSKSDGQRKVTDQIALRNISLMSLS